MSGPCLPREWQRPDAWTSSAFCLLAMLVFAIGVFAEIRALSPRTSPGWTIALQFAAAFAVLLGVALGGAAWFFWQVFKDFTF